MEYRNLEITISSAKDLKNVNIFTKMDVYVVVMIADDPRSRQRTPTDKDGGKNPKWNHKMTFLVNEAAANQNRSTLVFEIKSDRALGDRDIGEVFVPVKELLDDDSDKDGKVDESMKREKSVSYSVRTPSGKEKGILNFSYKIGDKVDAATVGATNFMEKKFGDEPVMAYPAGNGPNYPYQSQPGAAPTYAHPPQGYAPPPPQGYAAYAPPPPQGAGYMYPPPAAGYPPQGYPTQGYGGYPPQMPQGYGGYPPQQAGGYGYPGAQMVQKPKRKMGGMGLGMGLGAGLLGGLLIGDMVSDVGDMAAYDDAMGGFDF